MSITTNDSQLGGLPSKFKTNIVNQNANCPASTVVGDNDLIITKASNPKTSQTTKNGRYISRVIDSLMKSNKRDGVSEHDKQLNNLSLYWFVQSLLLSAKSYDDNNAQDKLFEWQSLLNKFDRDEADYTANLKYLHTQLGELVAPSLDVEGIASDNFMRSNFAAPDPIGLTTYTADKFFDHEDLVLKGKTISVDRPEDDLPDYPIKYVGGSNDIDDNVPKIIHLIYYKTEIDMSHLYSHIATYSANRTSKIIVWMYKYPDHGLRSNDHVEFRLFNTLSNGNYKYTLAGDNEKGSVKKLAADTHKFTSMDKYKLKYYLLKEFGGIYVDYNVAGVKKFHNNLFESNFVSVFTSQYKEQQYICPLGFFMGFSPDHPYVNYVLENFKEGSDFCKMEYIYLRSALLKSNDQNIKLLYQSPDDNDTNKSYIRLYTKDDMKDTTYFTFSDFDKTISVVTDEGSDDDKPVINDAADDVLQQELDEINDLAANIVDKHKNRPGDSPILYALIWLGIGLVSAWHLGKSHVIALIS